MQDKKKKLVKNGIQVFLKVQPSGQFYHHISPPLFYLPF